MPVPANSYQVKLPIFEGPLDLLLYLIEREELDITAVSLAAVTEQYLAYMSLLENLVVDQLADFLVIAALLAGLILYLVIHMYVRPLRSLSAYIDALRQGRAGLHLDVLHAADPPVKVTHLRCEYLVDPVGIDPALRVQFWEHFRALARGGG